MKISLVVLNSGKSAGQVIPVNLAQFVVGRDPQCQLRPASALISKRHCALLVKDGIVSVRDFDSTNGTFVNDQPIKGEVVLQNDDVLKIGPLEFRIAISGSAIVPTPTASNPKKPTPVPASKNASQEDIAALLLGLDDVDATSAADVGVPDGSTIMELPIPAEVTKKPDEKKKTIAVGSAQSAAQALFAKYNKRTTR